MIMNLHLMRYTFLEHADFISNKTFVSLYDDVELS